MKRLIPILFILATFNGWLHGQVTQPPGVILVGTAPSGACTAGVQGQMVRSYSPDGGVTFITLFTDSTPFLTPTGVCIINGTRGGTVGFNSYLESYQ